MYPDKKNIIVPAATPVNVTDTSEHYTDAISAFRDDKQGAFRRARLTFKIDAAGTPTARITLWVQARSAGGTWFDVCRESLNALQVSAAMALASPEPVIDAEFDVTGDEIRVGYKAAAYTAGNYYIIAEMNLDLLVW